MLRGRWRAGVSVCDQRCPDSKAIPRRHYYDTVSVVVFCLLYFRIPVCNFLSYRKAASVPDALLYPPAQQMPLSHEGVTIPCCLMSPEDSLRKVLCFSTQGGGGGGGRRQG